jgi:hypothetical protein
VPFNTASQERFMEIKGRGIGGLVLGVVLMVVALAVIFLMISANSVVPTVPDQTNDETEVVPS